MIKFNINLENKITDNTQTVPDFKNANFEAFRNSLTNVDWEDLLGGNAEEMWGEFLRVLKDQEKNYIPYKIKRTSGDSKPKWWNIPIGNALNSRNRAYKRYKFSPTIENTNCYFSSRLECKRLVRFYKREFELNIAQECKENPKMFYRYVNKKSIKNPIGLVLDADGTQKTSNVDIAKTLNEFFLSVFTEENLSHIPRMEDLRNFTPENILDSLEIYEEEVAFQIEKLLANKSPGPDGLYLVHLKILKDELVKPLTMIFNKSLQEGIVPKDFRMANIIAPIFKKG